MGTGFGNIGNTENGSGNENLQETKAKNLKSLKESHKTAYSTRFQKMYNYIKERLDIYDFTMEIGENIYSDKSATRSVFTHGKTQILKLAKIIKMQKDAVKDDLDVLFGHQEEGQENKDENLIKDCLKLGGSIKRTQNWIEDRRNKVYSIVKLANRQAKKDIAYQLGEELEETYKELSEEAEKLVFQAKVLLQTLKREITMIRSCATEQILSGNIGLDVTLENSFLEPEMDESLTTEKPLVPLKTFNEINEKPKRSSSPIRDAGEINNNNSMLISNIEVSQIEEEPQELIGKIDRLNSTLAIEGPVENEITLDIEQFGNKMKDQPNELKKMIKSYGKLMAKSQHIMTGTRSNVHQLRQRKNQLNSKMKKEVSKKPKVSKNLDRSLIC